MAKRKRRRSYRRRRSTTRRYRRRRNPALKLPGGLKLPSLQPVMYGLVGALGAQALPNLVMPTQNVGMTGALLELGSTVLVGMGMRMVGGTAAMTAALTGGGIRVVYRLLAEQKLLSKVPGLSGTEAVGPVPGFAGYIDAGMGGYIDAGSRFAPKYLPEMDGYQEAYEYRTLYGAG